MFIGRCCFVGCKFFLSKHLLLVGAGLESGFAIVLDMSVATGAAVWLCRGFVWVLILKFSTSYQHFA
jgi:hypothetical protein